MKSSSTVKAVFMALAFGATSNMAYAGIDDGLVAYYPFNGNATDESGNGNDGTVNGATLTADRFGNSNSAYSFEGLGYIDTFSLNDVSVFSFSVWAFLLPNYTGEDWRDIFSGDNGDNDRALFINTDNQIYIQDGRSAINTNIFVQSEIWNHFVVQYTDNDILLYLNGEQVWTAGYATDGWNEDNWHIGNAVWNGGSHYFVGKIDDIRIYNRALSQSEIQELYNENGGGDDTMHTLAVAKPSNGTVTSKPTGINCGSQCEAKFTAGVAIILTAKPNDGYQFIGWGGDCAGTGDCTVTMNNDVNVSATFKAAKYSLSVSRVGNGAITSTPTGINCSSTSNNCSAKLSGKVTLTAKADAGYQFAGWTGACTNKTGDCTVNITANTTVTATFTSTGAADFVITDLTLIPSVPSANSTFLVAVTIKNQGTAAADGGYIDVWANQSSVMTCGSDNLLWADVGTLKAGATKTLAFRLRAGSKGEKTLRAFVDSWCETTESKDDNNQFTKTYTVK